jgi:hypothetical protein
LFVGVDCAVTLASSNDLCCVRMEIAAYSHTQLLEDPFGRLSHAIAHAPFRASSFDRLSELRVSGCIVVYSRVLTHPFVRVYVRAVCDLRAALVKILVYTRLLTGSFVRVSALSSSFSMTSFFPSSTLRWPVASGMARTSTWTTMAAIPVQARTMAWQALLCQVAIWMGGTPVSTVGYYSAQSDRRFQLALNQDRNGKHDRVLKSS